jgi:hypothetical protein
VSYGALLFLVASGASFPSAPPETAAVTGRNLGTSAATDVVIAGIKAYHGR